MEDNLRSTLESRLAYHRAAIELAEKMLADLNEFEGRQSESPPESGDVVRQGKPVGELAEHMVVSKSIPDAAKEVLRHVGKSLDSREIASYLVKVGYNFGEAKQPVKSVGKSLRIAAENGELTFNPASGKYWLKP